METPGVWNVILDGDLGTLAPGPSRPATNASCVHAVNERINEKTCYAHTPTPTHTHTISYNNEGKQRLTHIFHFLSLI